MSSGIKRCAFGRQCVIAEFHVGDRSRDDWTELTRLVCWGKCQMYHHAVCGETTCCQRRSGRVDDEGGDLLSNSDLGGERGGGEQGGGGSR
jgi:hypothetical protein